MKPAYPAIAALALLASVSMARLLAAPLVPVFDVAEVGVPPRLARWNPGPVQDFNRRHARLEADASARADFVLDEKGVSRDIRVAGSDRDLRAALRRSVEEARYVPAARDGHPVRVRLHLRMALEAGGMQIDWHGRLEGRP